ncbi:non-canonical purine NTP pyrophosphatase [Candidatus Parcubacteria bacterium]|nr:MAG: non-canonical purine NTP pyrophosphatase [Candidatus Parcubacteria bacterium]
MKILVATKNPAKLREVREFLKGDFEFVSLADLPGAPDVEETGSTFEENSLLKAKKYFEWSGIPAVADDGGLEIDALGGEPGVKSRRWPGYEAADEELITMALEKLRGVPRAKRTARLRTVGTYCDEKRTLAASGSIEGYIVEEAPKRWDEGYPFRSIFWIPKLRKMYQDLTPAEHDAVNHRRFAYGELARKILAQGG